MEFDSAASDLVPQGSQLPSHKSKASAVAPWWRRALKFAATVVWRWPSSPGF